MFLLLRQKHVDSFCGIWFFPDFHLVSIFLCLPQFIWSSTLDAGKKATEAISDRRGEGAMGPMGQMMPMRCWDIIILFVLSAAHRAHEPWRALAQSPLNCSLHSSSYKQNDFSMFGRKRFLKATLFDTTRKLQGITMFDVWWRLMYDIAELSAQNH